MDITETPPLNVPLMALTFDDENLASRSRARLLISAVASGEPEACRVGADLKKRGWRREFGASFSGLEAFYLTDADQARLREMTFISRWLHPVRVAG